MKKGLFTTSAMVLLLVFLTKYAVSGDQKAEGVSQEQIIQNMHRIQIPFIANNGQVDERVAFYANTFGGTVFVTNDGEIVYSLPKSADDDNRSQKTGVRIQKCGGEWHLPDVIHDAGCEIHDNGNLSIADRESCLKDNVSGIKPSILNSQSPIQNPQSEIHGVALRETLVGASAGKITGEQPAVTKINYFKGSDPSKWKSNITTYDVVNLGEVYKGIELKLKAYGNNVEKLFYVKPGADPDQIKINLSGIQPPLSPFSKGDLAESPSTIGSTDASQHSTAKPLLTMESITKSPSTKGSLAKSPLKKGGRGVVSPDESRASGLWINEQSQLVAETELGPVIFTKPVAYQEIDGKRVDVAVEYEIYAVPQVVHRNKPVLTSGRNAKNAKESIVVNTESAGNVCPPLAGAKGVERDSPHVIQPTTNPKSKRVNLSSTEIGDPKLEYGFKVASYDKTKELVIDPLLASTYLGGSDWDSGYSLALDTSGNVYVTGYTESSDFPTTSGAHDTSFNGSYYDVFVSKLDGSLTSLLASTYLGGSSSSDYGYSLALDTSGNVYVTGGAGSSDFPTTSGAYDTSFNGSYSDVFISKLDGNLSATSTTPTPTPTPTPATCTDNYEPNDSSTQAYGYLTSGSSYSGKICSGSDVDWFKVNITTSGTISIDLTVPSSSDYYVELYGPSYTWVAGNHDVSISYNATTTGTYYIRVLGYPEGNGSYNTTSSYTLAYTFTSTTSATPTPFPTPTPTSESTPTPTPTSTEDEDLLKKYAPILYMHSEEQFHPTKVEVMLENSELYEKICKKEKKDGTCKKYKGKQVKEMKDKELTLEILIEDYNYEKEKYYLKLKDDAVEAIEDDLVYWNWKKDQTVYSRMFTDYGRMFTDKKTSKTVLQYWFFYVYNDWGGSYEGGNKHEGDWEMIQIILDSNKQPLRITYSFHHGGQTFSWDDKEISNITLLKIKRRFFS